MSSGFVTPGLDAVMPGYLGSLGQSLPSVLDTDAWIYIIAAVIWVGTWLVAEVRKRRKPTGTSEPGVEEKRQREDAGDAWVVDELEIIEDEPPRPARPTGQTSNTGNAPSATPTTAKSAPPRSASPGSWQQLVKDPGAWVEHMQAQAERAQQEQAPPRGDAENKAASPPTRERDVRDARDVRRGREHPAPDRPARTDGSRPRREQPRPAAGQRTASRPVRTARTQPARPSPPRTSAATSPVETPKASTADVAETEIGGEAHDPFALGVRRGAGSNSVGAASLSLGRLDRTALRRAIVLAEVLGPPVALRQPDQQAGAVS